MNYPVDNEIGASAYDPAIPLKDHSVCGLTRDHRQPSDGPGVRWETTRSRTLSGNDLFDQDEGGRVGQSMGVGYALMSQAIYDPESHHFPPGLILEESGLDVKVGFTGPLRIIRHQVTELACPLQPAISS